MIDQLESGEVDLALPVTDGLIAAVAQGRNVQVAGTYVQSPLLWGVWVLEGSPYITSSAALFAQPRPLKIGVSRLGSGSHSMALFLAAQQQPPVPLEDLEFVVANTFEGLHEGIRQRRFICFLWEHYTTAALLADTDQKLPSLKEIDTIPVSHLLIFCLSNISFVSGWLGSR